METKYPSRYFSYDGHDFGRRESVDGREDRRLHQPGVGQRHEVVVAVDEVELSGVLERFGDVKVLGYFGIDGGILFIPPVDHGMQASAGHGIPGGEQRHIPATGDQSFGDVAGDRLPRAVLPGRRSPGYGRQDGHSFVGDGHAGNGASSSMAASTSASGTVAKPVA